MFKKITVALLIMASAGAWAQQKVGEKWVDNNLRFKVVNQSIKTEGLLTICIEDSSRTTCIENLQSGFEIKIYDAANQLLWEGIGSGRRDFLKVPQPLPTASYLTLKAFKPFVINTTTGNKIYQDKNILTRITVE